MTAIALTIAGSDSGGGAGVQADLKTFSALGVYGASAITAVTAQNTRGVAGVHPVPPAMIAAQVAAVLGDLAVGAVKIGMLGTAEAVEAVADAIAGHAGPVVLDPVMVAKSGDALLAPEAVAALCRHLLPRASLVTPNLPEAARLTGRPVASDEAEVAAQGRALLDAGAGAVLMKGGHGAGAECRDLLLDRAGLPLLFSAPRQATRNTHGTGCTLSAAIAAGLARGLPLAEAVRAAHGWLQAAIGAADRLAVGHGQGPVHHFHAVWT